MKLASKYQKKLLNFSTLIKVEHLKIFKHIIYNT